MRKGEEEETRPPGQGNYLAKHRRNFYLSNRCWQMMHAISLDLGLNHSGTIEIAIREMYRRVIGNLPPIEYRDGRIAR
jgi:hypothetical protein